MLRRLFFRATLNAVDERFAKYARLFEENGFHLYMVGGTSRDYLLGLPYTDFDFVTDATPEDEKKFLPNAKYDFAKFGSIKIFEDGVEVDITTLRKEEGYDDRRHPKKITFIKDLETDSQRRDFTINALYIDLGGNVYDYHGGLADLKKGIIRFIGDPKIRIEEDPLRIMRAERFAKKLGFEIEEESKKAIEEGRNLLSLLNPNKIKMERLKESK